MKKADIEAVEKTMVEHIQMLKKTSRSCELPEAVKALAEFDSTVIREMAKKD